jgi:hypothetical protein
MMDIDRLLHSTEKVKGMFATLVIVLPSCYTGGQVHVSHAGLSKVFDLAPDSLQQTFALSWYTDVVHEVKPITSGYRLALSYNLIHTSKVVPRPTLPNMHTAVTRLRHVMHKWSKDAYPTMHKPMLAYIFSHQYSAINLETV